jgi:signal transduction histidine kinase
LQVPALPAITSLRDPEAMQLVLRNLLDNAIKYSNKGTRVQIELRLDGSDIVLDVEDQGRGMDADELRHAFTPFWRGKDAATGGSGLGLHLVRELVAAHGGSVQARSDGPGRGSEFTVRLPHRGVS